ncbi:unnamed protein product [Calypogeia fissa]
MAAIKEEPVSAPVMQSVPPDAPGVVAVKQEQSSQAAPSSVVTPPPAAAVSVAAPSSVALPTTTATTPATTSTLSPRQTIASTPQGVYPKPLATHDAVMANEELFMETFYRFHTAMKIRPSIPKMGGKDLDVHLLYREVSSRGGLQAVIKDRKWKEITLVFDLPRTTTSASYVLRKYYITLLFHYEQVYRNGVTGALLTPPAALSGSSPSVQPGDSAISEGVDIPPPIRKRVRRRRILQPQFPTMDVAEAIGTTVSGSIDGKLDIGYLVTMVVGGEKVKGVLYHVPPGSKTQYASLPGLFNSMSAEIGMVRTRRKRRRKDEMPKKDPNAPRPNRTGYNFFFAEQRLRLKALYPDKDREISRMIGEAWNGLTDEAKLPYQQRGEEDKERFKREFQDYHQKLKSGYYDNPANVKANGQGKTAEEPSAPEPGVSSGTSVPHVVNSAHARVSEQLSSEQKPVMSVVPTQ